MPRFYGNSIEIKYNEILFIEAEIEDKTAHHIHSIFEYGRKR